MGYQRLIVSGAHVAGSAGAPITGRRLYDLRHACLSTWFNGGVEPIQVAEWADNSVQVLLRGYARCIVGREDVNRRRIEEAFGDIDCNRSGNSPHGSGR
jgi:hypothetical protein